MCRHTKPPKNTQLPFKWWLCLATLISFRVPPRFQKLNFERILLNRVHVVGLKTMAKMVINATTFYNLSDCVNEIGVRTVGVVPSLDILMHMYVYV